jgi:hypothetical protein
MGYIVASHRVCHATGDAAVIFWHRGYSPFRPIRIDM